jgi:hypothetical protein
MEIAKEELDALSTEESDHLSQAARLRLSVWRLRDTMIKYRQEQAAEEELARSVRAFWGLSMQEYQRQQQL